VEAESLNGENISACASMLHFAMTHQGILLEQLEALGRSCSGYLSNILNLCNQLHESLKDFSDAVKV